MGTAANGREALVKIDRQDPGWDLVLTDLVMPAMGGADLYEILRNRGILLPFLFVSGYGPEEHVLPTNHDRSRVFRQKPWTIEDLAWKVRQAFDTRRQRPSGAGPLPPGWQDRTIPASGPARLEALGSPCDE